MPDNQAVKNKKDLLLERLHGKNPEETYQDDDALFGKLYDDYEEYDKMSKEYETLKQDSDVIKEFFATSPDAAVLFSEVRKDPKHNMVSALVKLYGDAFRDALEDPEVQEELAKASQDYAQRIADNDALEAQAAENADATIKVIDEVQAEMGLNEEDIDAAVGLIHSIAADYIGNKITADNLRMAINAIKHDDDVAQADKEGELRGRNAKIEEKLRKSAVGDGTAHLGSKNAGGNGRPMPDFGAIGANYGTMNIFERGGEKRKKYNN